MKPPVPPLCKPEHYLCELLPCGCWRFGKFNQAAPTRGSTYCRFIQQASPDLRLQRPVPSSRVRTGLWKPRVHKHAHVCCQSVWMTGGGGGGVFTFCQLPLCGCCASVHLVRVSVKSISTHTVARGSPHCRPQYGFANPIRAPHPPPPRPPPTLATASQPWKLCFTCMIAASSLYVCGVGLSFHVQCLREGQTGCRRSQP